MKKLILVFITLATILFLSGCDLFGNNQTTTNPLTQQTTQETTQEATQANSDITQTTEESALTIQLKYIYNLALDANAFSGTYQEWLETVRGPQGEPGKSVSFQVADGYIQWQYVGDTTWSNLIELTALTGSDGADGTDGREVTFQVADGYIQWKYVGDSNWKNLIDLTTLQNEAGIVDNMDRVGTDGLYFDLTIRNELPDMKL